MNYKVYKRRTSKQNESKPSRARADSKSKQQVRQQKRIEPGKKKTWKIPWETGHLRCPEPTGQGMGEVGHLWSFQSILNLPSGTELFYHSEPWFLHKATVQMGHHRLNQHLFLRWLIGNYLGTTITTSPISEMPLVMKWNLLDISSTPFCLHQNCPTGTALLLQSRLA